MGSLRSGEGMKVALVHDWLNGMRGGEKCLEVLCELFPEAPVYSLFYEKGRVSPLIARHAIHTSWLQRMPWVKTHYRYYLPLYAAAIESMDVSGYDLLISTSHCVAKGAKKGKQALHLCYCFTPVRYAWGFFDEYFGGRDIFSRVLIRGIIQRIRSWDFKASGRVDHFVAISEHVKKRIRTYYGREAEVIYPPCDTDFYTPGPAAKPEDFYLIVSALVPYKRIELAVEAFSHGDRRLVIIGDGPQRKSLEKKASKNIQFLGWQEDAVLREHYRRARALVFPGEEDFGIVPVEAQACGCPVIAYGGGGALETVVEGRTGLFFQEFTAESLQSAVERFERIDWDPKAARENALVFSKKRFKDEMKNFIERVIPVKAGIKPDPRSNISGMTGLL